MKNFLTFLTVFFSIFGPRLGLVDFSLVGVVLGILLLTTCRRVIFSEFQIAVVGLTTFILIYSCLIFALTQFQDAQIFLRYVRALISTAVLSTVFYNANVSVYNVLRYVHISININALFIIVQAAFPPILAVMGPWVGYTKPVYFLRAPGLTNGFDTAGYFCLIGVVISLLNIFNDVKPVKNYWGLLYITIASLFTSRNVMSISMILIAFATIKLIFSRNGTLRFFGYFNIVAGFFLVYYFIAPILVASVPFLEGYSVYFKSSPFFNATESFAAGTAEQLQDMFFLPDAIGETIFGAGYDNMNSDVGYVKIIFMIGIVGFLLILFFHLLLFIKTIMAYRMMSFWEEYSLDKNASKVILYTILTVLLLLPMFNIKGLYLYSRGLHELLIIFCFTLYRAVFLTMPRGRFEKSELD